MNRDFKIGTAIGLLLIGAISLWLAVHPSLSIKARMAEQSAADTTTAPPEGTAASQTPAVPQSQPSASSASENSVQPKVRFHIVKKGDTLSSISKQYYGTTTKWQKILDANRSVLKNPNTLTPGTKLIIPE